MREALKQSIHKKINISDIVYVVNIDNYIGEDTKEEIEYAKSQEKNY